MNIMPSEYQKLELQRTEKMFIRYAELYDDFGFLFLNTNAALIENEKQHIVLCREGILFVKFFDSFKDISNFKLVMKAYYKSVFSKTFECIYEKLRINKSLLKKDGKLFFAVNYICVFPNINREDIVWNPMDMELKEFTNNNCMFASEFNQCKSVFPNIVNDFLYKYPERISKYYEEINTTNMCSIVQRIIPEYTTIRMCSLEDKETFKGVDNELLVVTDEDIAVKAFMLDEEQINIVNKINKGEQLILACAGSGKSVILISKCFKAARMNPNKKFLITCKSRQLQSLYLWYIDRAGLTEKNVECITFHKLCKKLANKNHFYLPSQVEDWPSVVMERYNHGYIRERYYGIFIDEVQLFEQEWYKLCFHLLEHKESNEHLFVICGDKTQEIKKRQKHGRAPWNVGEGYPNYRGGNKNIRIEKNYRNCIEINTKINKFASCAKELLSRLPGEKTLDPDLFLRGKSIRNGIGVYVKMLNVYTSDAEADAVIKAVHKAHDEYKIPYDEIAVVMYNRKYARKLNGWKESVYRLEECLLHKMRVENIPGSSLYYDQLDASQVRYGNHDGIALISFESVLGLDFRAVIVCGLKPFGDYDKTKYLDDRDINRLNINDERIANIKRNINYLYVACTRARDLLYIIQPEKEEESLYMRLLSYAMKEEE